MLTIVWTVSSKEAASFQTLPDYTRIVIVDTCLEIKLNVLKCYKSDACWVCDECENSWAL